MEKEKICKWYKVCPMKRFYKEGKLDKKWIEKYCWNGGKGCMRKKRFETEGYISPDYILPDGTIDKDLES